MARRIDRRLPGSYDATFASFAVGTILVVATAVLGSLTVLPALLSWFGDKVDAGRIPGLYRRRPDGRIWNGVLKVVPARPLISAVLAAGALATLALPALDLRTKAEGLDDLPPKEPIVLAMTTIDAAFPSKTQPAEVVVKAATVKDAAFVLRGQVVPSTFGQLPGATVLVTGNAAADADFNARLHASAPWVFGFVLGLAFVLLLVSFRSVVVALTGVVLNLFSVAAAYGMLVWVFQYGHFQDLLQFKAASGITNWMPLFLFIILFGLSMDYHVFVLSRIREGHDRGLPTKQAVREGIGRTAGVITGAALVMVAVFALFATLPLAATEQLGVGLAAAVLLDATIIRAVLLPAVMAMLGDKNWWLPRWLGRLPQVAHEPPAQVTARGDHELVAA